jgi:opacity protein-like surface antigen
MSRIAKGLLAAVSFVCIAGSAQAAVITEDVTFSASGLFGFYYHDPVPTSPVMGSFAFSFDPTSSSVQFGTASNFLNITVGPSGFNYNPSTGRLIIGGDENTWFGDFTGTDDFLLGVDGLFFDAGGNVVGTPTSSVFVYTTASTRDLFQSEIDLSIHPAALEAVPEPLTLSLFGVGVGVAFMRRRRKRTV